MLFVFLLSSMIGTGTAYAVPGAMLLLVCHLLSFYTSFLWLTSVFFEKKKYGLFVFGLLGLLLALTPFRLWIEIRFIHRPFLVLRGRRLIGLVLFSELSSAGFGFLFRLALDNYASRRKADEVEKDRLQTELKFLKSQMNPHFLFNTINNVYALALTEPDKTPPALLKLSGLLRYLLYECDQQVPFSKELQAIESYIALFQLRYEAQLDIRLDVLVSSPDMFVEPMLFLPLLENAVKHSGIGVSPGAFIVIRLYEEAGQLTGSFLNSKSSLPVHRDVGGIGLQNIRKRLEMLQPGLARENLSVQDHTDRFEVFIKIPRK